jgi:hypothetical protein
MNQTTIKLNGKSLIAFYEFERGESGDWETPPTNPSVRLWSVTDEDDNDLTSNLTTIQFEAASQMCFENEIN